jgi:hypothetical protein
MVMELKWTNHLPPIKLENQLNLVLLSSFGLTMYLTNRLLLVIINSRLVNADGMERTKTLADHYFKFAHHVDFGSDNGVEMQFCESEQFLRLAANQGDITGQMRFAIATACGLSWWTSSSSSSSR